MANVGLRLCTKHFTQSHGLRYLANKVVNDALIKKPKPWATLFKSFQHHLDRRPIAMNAFIGGFFMCAGDLLQQLYFNDHIKWKEVSYLFFHCKLPESSIAQSQFTDI